MALDKTYRFTYSLTGTGSDEEAALEHAQDAFVQDPGPPLDTVLLKEETDDGEVFFDHFWKIYSPSEELWWNNENGFGSMEAATRFTEEETKTLGLVVGGIWVKVDGD